MEGQTRLVGLSVGGYRGLIGVVHEMRPCRVEGCGGGIPMLRENIENTSIHGPGYYMPCRERTGTVDTQRTSSATKALNCEYQVKPPPTISDHQARCNQMKDPI